MRYKAPSAQKQARKGPSTPKKIMENTQQDLNIALMNELAMIFAKLGIDAHEVMAAAGTKWNLLPFKPGLAGCRTNDGIGPYVASELVKAMIKAGHTIANARVLVMGFTFKENCPDLRNTRVIDVVKELQDFGCQMDVTDCWADSAEAAVFVNKDVASIEFRSLN